jgi:MFS transporter, DHA2 family, multidrug resistance protein
VSQNETERHATEANAAGGAPRAGRREWIGLAVIALPCVVYAMDLTVLNLAVPHLSADLRPSSAQLLWIVDIYGFLVAGSLITMGTLGDRIGRRRLLMIGGAAFGVASVLAAFATSAPMLIATRALLGIAGATLAPSTLSLIRNMFLDARQRTFAIGVWVASFSTGAALGPLFGGILLEHFWWGSVFLLALPVMVLLLVLGPVLLPEFRDPDAGRLDVLSAAMSLAAVLSMIFGFKLMAQDGFGWRSAVAITAGLAVGVAFVRRQRTLDDPLIDMRLFRVPAFSMTLVTATVGMCVAFGLFLFIAQYLQLVLGLSPWKAGLWTLPSSAGFVVSSLLSPFVVRRIRPGFVIAGSLGVAAIGLALLTQIGDSPGLPLLVTGGVIFSLGLSPVGTVATDIIIGSAPPERAGAASAISETSFELGGALGIAILGSIGTGVYRGAMADALPAGLSPEVADAARDTLGGAVAVAQRMPGQLGAELVGAARQAFAQSFELTAAIGAGLAITAAIVAMVILRHVRNGHGVEPRPEPVAAKEPTSPARADLSSSWV